MNLTDQIDAFGDNVEMGGDPAPTRFDGHDQDAIGTLEGFGMEPRIVYLRPSIMQSLVDDGMDEECAEEWYEFNMVGAGVKMAPVVLNPFDTPLTQSLRKLINLKTAGACHDTLLDAISELETTARPWLNT